MLGVVPTIDHEAVFKVVCDGLLRHEVGPSVQTFAARGRDGGIDARYRGEYAGKTGLWIFQYKFVHPSTDQRTARRRVLAYYRRTKSRKSEFDKVKEQAPVGYVLVTNVEMTRAMADELEGQAASVLDDCLLCLWDRSAMEALLSGKEHLLLSAGSARYDGCKELIVQPAWALVEIALNARADWRANPLWPLELTFRQRHEPTGKLFPPSRLIEEWDLHIDDDAKAASLVVHSPLFEYASRVLFANAFRNYQRAIDLINGLEETIFRHVVDLNMSFQRSKGPMGFLPEAERRTASMAFAYVSLSTAWGVPANSLGHAMGTKSGDKDRLLYRGKTLLFGAQCRQVAPALDEIVSSLSARGVPADVRLARGAMEQQLERLRDDLWWAAHLGIDAPPVSVEEG